MQRSRPKEVFKTKSALDLSHLHIRLRKIDKTDPKTTSDQAITNTRVVLIVSRVRMDLDSLLIRI